MKKKILSLLIVLFMIVSTNPNTTYAAACPTCGGYMTVKNTCGDYKSRSLFTCYYSSTGCEAQNRIYSAKEVSDCSNCSYYKNSTLSIGHLHEYWHSLCGSTSRVCPY